MKLRKAAAILAAGLLVAAVSTFAYLEYKGVHVADILTARQAPPLPQEETAGQPAPEGLRPPTWAQPMAVAGLPNLHKVSDDLYRGAQPTPEGLVALKAMGIKTVINLRTLHNNLAEKLETSPGVVSIPTEAWNLNEADIVQFLRIATDKTRTPIFVHCQHGADRTGTMCAAYRIVIQGWTKDEAIREMTRGGFGYHTAWANLPVLIDQLDIDSIRKQVGRP